jgi:hypothetical protein
MKASQRAYLDVQKAEQMLVKQKAAEDKVELARMVAADVATYKAEAGGPLRTGTRPTLNHLLLLHVLRVSVRTMTQVMSCPDLGRVLVLIDLAARRRRSWRSVARTRPESRWIARRCWL